MNYICSITKTNVMKKKYTYTVDTGFSEKQIQLIKPKFLAKKHKVTPEYVRMVIKGKRLANTDTAKAILTDAKKIIELIESI